MFHVSVQFIRYFKPIVQIYSVVERCNYSITITDTKEEFRIQEELGIRLLLEQFIVNVIDLLIFPMTSINDFSVLFVSTSVGYKTE